MPSYFEINVARHGHHYFATAPRSLTTSDEFDAALADFKIRFPAAEGFTVTATYWLTTGCTPA